MIPEIVPVFALPSRVFFPKTSLPLHIFEPRYREMLQDSMNNHKVITMALLKEGWEGDYEGAPEIYSRACAGRIVQHQLLSDGRSNILLYGLTRVRLGETLREKNYRQARAEPLPYEDGQNSHLELPVREELIHHLKAYGKVMGVQSQIELFLERDPVDGSMVNFFSSELDFTVSEKQYLLESNGLTQQCQRLINLIHFRVSEAVSGLATA